MHSKTVHVPQKPVDTILVRRSTVYGDCNKASLVIPVQMVQGDLKVSGSALIDSGVQGNFIDKQLVGSSGLKTETLYPLIETLNMDGSKNSGGIVDEHTWLKVILEDQAYWLQFYITNLGLDCLILGDPWLRVANPQINWPQWVVCIGQVQMA